MRATIKLLQADSLPISANYYAEVHVLSLNVSFYFTETLYNIRFCCTLPNLNHVTANYQSLKKTDLTTNVFVYILVRFVELAKCNSLEALAYLQVKFSELNLM